MKKADDYVGIYSLQFLDSFLEHDFNEYYVLLKGGGVSSKHITLADDGIHKYEVFNLCDETTDLYTEEELMDSIIGDAIKRDALVCEIF